MAIFISYRISTRDNHISPRADMGRGLRLGMMWKCHITICLSYIFHFDRFAYLIIVCGVNGKTVECSVCGDVFFFFFFFFFFLFCFVFFLFVFFFCLGKKKAASPTWIGGMGLKPHHPRDPISYLLLSASDMCLKAMLVSHLKMNIYVLVNVK